jgi:hypothetical protein
LGFDSRAVPPTGRWIGRPPRRRFTCTIEFLPSVSSRESSLRSVGLPNPPSIPFQSIGRQNSHHRRAGVARCTSGSTLTISGRCARPRRTPKSSPTPSAQPRFGTCRLRWLDLGDERLRGEAPTAPSGSPVPYAMTMGDMMDFYYKNHWHSRPTVQRMDALKSAR